MSSPAFQMQNSSYTGYITVSTNFGYAPDEIDQMLLDKEAENIVLRQDLARAEKIIAHLLDNPDYSLKMALEDLAKKLAEEKIKEELKTLKSRSSDYMWEVSKNEPVWTWEDYSSGTSLPVATWTNTTP